MGMVTDILVLPPAEPAGWDWPLIERTSRSFPAAAMSRAQELLRAGRVAHVTVGSDFIEARVAGELTVETPVLQRLGGEVLLDCSCATGSCEHLAVLLLVLREHLQTPSPAPAAAPSGSNPPADVAASADPALCVILEPWKPSVRFLREGSGTGSLLGVETLTLREVSNLARARSEESVDGWCPGDRALVSHLRGVTWHADELESREWRPGREVFSDLLSKLSRHPRVFDHHGRPLQVLPCTAQASTRLFMNGGRLFAKVTSRPSITPPAEHVRPHGWRIQGDGYCWDNPESLEDAQEQLLQAGFVLEPGEEQFSLPPDQLDHWLGHQLPRWQDQGREIELDGSVRSLLEGSSRVRSKLKIVGTEGIDWFEISWRLQAGEEILDSGDIRALRVFPGKYYRLASGRIVSVEKGAIRRQLDALVQMGFSPLRSGLQRLPMRFLARAIDLGDDSRPEDLDVAPALQNLYRRLKARVPYPEIQPPVALREILRPYQLAGFRFLCFLNQHRLGGVLADDMGLGKTLQTLALVQHLREFEGPRPNLVVCPTSVAPNWLEEAEKFVPQLSVLHLQSGSQIRRIEPGDYDILVASYGLLQRYELSYPFRCLVLDEAQNIKNPRAKRTRAVKKLQGDFKLALTGTPIENNVTELWSLFDFLLPDILGSATSFQRLYSKPIMKDRDERALQSLTEVVRPFILRRLKASVAPELPEKVEQNVYCDLSLQQKKIYREVAARVRGEVSRYIEAHGMERSRIPILTALMRLRQLCCHPALIDPELATAGSGKLNIFLEQLETILSGGHRVIVFSQFVSMLRILEDELSRRRIECLYLDGATRDRGRLVRRFQQGDEHQVFLMSLKAGGTGLNLTAADYVILYEPWWNPAVEQQAIDRIHRIGQDKPVTAYRMIVRGTVEEKMLELHRRKQFLAESLLESQLEAEELLNLLAE